MRARSGERIGAVTDASKGPLQGITVIALEQAVAAPLCTSRMAAAGARVIKVERAGGDFARSYDRAAKGEASYFVWLNQGKESIELDLKNAEDQALLARMVSQADVLIQNLAPGATERLGFGSAQLRARHPRLITCDISGYGSSGSYQTMKAYDFLVQCEAGLVSISGAPDAPGRVGVSVCDIGAGMNALIGIQQALIARTQTGQGSGVEVSLFDTLADWMTVPALHEQYGQGAPEPAGMAHPSIAPYGGFECADGQTLALSIQNEREWRSFCESVLNAPNLAADPRFLTNNLRVENRATLERMIQDVFAQHDADAMSERLRQGGIAFGRVNRVKDLLSHPQLRMHTIALSSGELLDTIAPAVRSTLDSAQTDGSSASVPRTGQHNEAIRAEFSSEHQ